MPIQAEIWRQDFVENLFPNNTFSQFAVNHDANVLEGAVVHVPRAGASPTVVRNRSSLPASVTTRTDTDLNYQLTEYSTDPVHLRNVEKYELSYDKRMSIIGEHVAALREAIHDDLLHTWLTGLPAGNIFQTTGTFANSRRNLVLADILRLKAAMDRANILEEGRMLLMPPDLHNQLFSIADLLSADAMGRTTVPNGVVSRVLGFQIMVRSYTPVLNNSLAVKAKTAAADAATDRQSIVAWSRYAVARALGEVNLFENVNDPLYYGDIYSAQVRAGGIRLPDNGVFVLTQALS